MIKILLTFVIALGIGFVGGRNYSDFILTFQNIEPKPALLERLKNTLIVRSAVKYERSILYRDYRYMIGKFPDTLVSPQQKKEMQEQSFIDELFEKNPTLDKKVDSFLASQEIDKFSNFSPTELEKLLSMMPEECGQYWNRTIVEADLQKEAHLTVRLAEALSVAFAALASKNIQIPSQYSGALNQEVNEGINPPGAVAPAVTTQAAPRAAPPKLAPRPATKAPNKSNGK